MKEIVFLLEEPSMRELLNEILPKVIPSHIVFSLHPHEGKQDLERSIPRKLKAWQNPQARFVILRDQDSGNCVDIKQRLHRLCEQTGREGCLIRIVCRELESWFLGDLVAIGTAYELSHLAKLAEKAKSRNPDRLANAAEELQKLVVGYQKVGGARTIAPHLDLENNRSKSFQVFLEGLQRLIGEME
jgi:hypothetical protein